MTWSLVAMIVVLALAAVLIAVLVAGIKQYVASEEHKRNLETLEKSKELKDGPPY